MANRNLYTNATPKILTYIKTKILTSHSALKSWEKNQPQNLEHTPDSKFDKNSALKSWPINSFKIFINSQVRSFYKNLLQIMRKKTSALISWIRFRFKISTKLSSTPSSATSSATATMSSSFESASSKVSVTSVKSQQKVSVSLTLLIVSLWLN